MTRVFLPFRADLRHCQWPSESESALSNLYRAFPQFNDRALPPFNDSALRPLPDIVPVSPEPGPGGLRLKSDAHRQSLTQSRATATLVLTDSEVYCMDGLKM